MSLIIALTLSFIGFVGLIVFLIKKYMGKNPREILEMSSKNPNKVLKSKFFPERLYLGKAITLDPLLKMVAKKTLFKFPDGPQIIKDFAYFDVDENEFEEIRFDKIGDQVYLLLYDTFEDVGYFISKLMTVQIPQYQEPDFIQQDVLTFTEDGKTFMFEDFSGLIQTHLFDQLGTTGKVRIIRVYSRDITDVEKEFLFCVTDKMGVVDYYTGLQISMLQFKN